MALFKPAFGPTIDQIHDLLTSGFQSLTLSNGKFLTASNKTRTTPSAGQYPFLSFRSGSGQLTPWKDFEWQLSWDIPATLTVQGPSEDGEGTAREAVFDIIARTTQIVGLPVDDDGAIVVLSDETIKLFDDGKLTFLCERGAPYVKSFNIRPIDDGVCAADLVFHVESTLSVDTRELVRMKVGVLGVNPVAPSSLYQDTTAEDGRGIAMVFGTDSERGFGGYTSSDPSTPPGVINSNQEQPDSNVAASQPLNQQTASVNVTPYSVALSAGAPTASVSAIAFALDSSSQYVTNSGTWSTTNAAVATVSAGVITRVAAGSCSVFCTYGGVASNSIAVTSS